MEIELRSITVETPYDTEAKLNHLGELRDEPGPDERTIDRREYGGHGYRPYDPPYFVSAHGPSEAADVDVVMENFRRFGAFLGGEVGMRGVKAKATLRIGDAVQTLETPGLWGIASDAPEEYFAEVARTEVGELRRYLDVLDVATATVAAEWADGALFDGALED